jgi:hypothetical protein
MNQRILTVVSATADPSREAELRADFQSLDSVPVDGLLRTELLRTAPGAWRIQTLWRDRDALVEQMRAATEAPAAPRIFLGADPSPETLEVMYEQMRSATWNPCAPRIFSSIVAHPSLEIFEVMYESHHSFGRHP